jgi:hypothetical protein
MHLKTVAFFTSALNAAIGKYLSKKYGQHLAQKLTPDVNAMVLIFGDFCTQRPLS